MCAPTCSDACHRVGTGGDDRSPAVAVDGERGRKDASRCEQEEAAGPTRSLPMRMPTPECGFDRERSRVKVFTARRATGCRWVHVRHSHRRPCRGREEAVCECRRALRREESAERDSPFPGAGHTQRSVAGIPATPTGGSRGQSVVPRRYAHRTPLATPVAPTGSAHSLSARSA